MSLIERFFGKKEEIPLQTSVEFNELHGWIETESARIFGGLGSHVQQKYDEITAILEDISTSRDQLIAARFGDKVYVRMAKAGTSNRDNVVKNLNIIIDRITVPGDPDPAVASEFHTSAKAILNNSLENAIRSQQYVKLLFPEEYKSVLFDLKHLDTVLDELVLPITEMKDRMEAYGRLPGEMAIIDQTRQQIGEQEKRISELQKRWDVLKGDLPALQSRVKELEHSAEFSKAQELEGQINNLKAQIAGTDSNIREQFAPLSKALNRMEKQDESGRYTLSSDTRSILRSLTSDPVSALSHDIFPFLRETRARVEDGSLGLKEQKKNKTLEQIERLVESEVISSLKSQRESCLEQRSRLLEELEGLTIYKEKTQLEKAVSDCREQIESTGQELARETDTVHRLTEELEQFRSDLNEHLNTIFEKDIMIIY